MKLYFIRHIPTGHFIPRPHGMNGRGGSHLEPRENKQDARIFYSERSAKIFLTTWLKGKVHAHRQIIDGHPGNDWTPDYKEDLRTYPVASRIREDMEIIEKEIDL